MQPSRNTSPSVSIVVPARNEARNLEVLIPTLCADELVFVVDAATTDDTLEVIAALAPDATVEIQRCSLGKGAALAQGLCAATGDIAVFMDADGSMDAAEVPAYVGALLAGADVAKGSRCSAGAFSHDLTLVRRVGNWGLRVGANTLFRTRWTELCYGYGALWTDLVGPLGLDEIAGPSEGNRPGYGQGFEIETLLFTRAARLGLRVVEVASIEHDRIHGETNLSAVRDGTRVLACMLTERLRPAGAR